MTQVTLAVVITHFLAQAWCVNVYNCKPKHCEVRLRTDLGWVCGRLRAAEDLSTYASFRGIPYAQPPLGDKRFKDLQPMDPWDRHIMLDATEDSPACPQTDIIFGRLPLLISGMSEDCIYLNLHVPYRFLPRFPWHIQKSQLPILVFIHGGAFQSGAGLTDALGPEFLMMRNIIVVTFNYRLNVFGFFSLNSKEIPGNQGFKDMVTLLRWVQRNALNFGGDPNNVTLMGQGAGATSAHILSLSKETEGLFHKVILMSSSAFPSYFTTSSEYTKIASGLFLQELGINQTDPVLVHQELTKISILKIMQANAVVQDNPEIVSFNPVIESEFPGCMRIIDEDPMALMAEGRGRKYPLLIGFNNNEAASLKWLFVKKRLLSILKQDKPAIVSPHLRYSLPKNQVEGIANKIYETYFNSNPTLGGLMDYFADMHFKHPSFKVAEWRAAVDYAPTYMYQLSYDFEHSPVRAAHWLDYRGSAHMDDLACVFRINSMMGPHITYPPRNKDDTIKYWMSYLITNFLICSNPTCNNNALWPAVTKENFQYNLINVPMKFQMMKPTVKEANMVKFFDSFDPIDPSKHFRSADKPMVHV